MNTGTLSETTVIKNLGVAKMDGRIPPVEVRRELRREVGFGCPIEGCRLPFLEYHHFDPPWHEGNVHNIEGMIALCPSHHSMADRGTWTKEELRTLKREGEKSPIKGKLHWNLKNSVLSAGKNLIIAKNQISLRVLGNEIFALKENAKGQLTVNAQLWSSSGELIIRIIDNDILLAPDKEVNDFVCNVSGNKIRIESRKNETYLEFMINREKTKKIEGISFKEYGFLENEVPFINLKAKVINNAFDLVIQEKQIVLDLRRVGYDKTNISKFVVGPSGSLNIMFENREFFHMG